MLTYGELRRYLVTEIASTNREYFRLKTELRQLESTLPKGSYIGTYQSNYKYPYHALGHKDAVLPSAKDPSKLTGKLHLGKDENPKYRQALLEIERMRTKQIKQETLTGLVAHLNALKEIYRLWRPEWRSRDLSDLIQIPGKKTPEQKRMLDFISSDRESIFDFIVRNHHSNSEH